MENQFELLDLSLIKSEELSEPSQDLSTNTDEKWSMDARSSCDEKVQFEEIDKMATGGPSTSGRMPSKSPRQREPMEKTPPMRKMNLLSLILVALRQYSMTHKNNHRQWR